MSLPWMLFALERMACPSCPTARAAREIFVSEDVLPRLSGAISPFIVTFGLAALIVSRICRLDRTHAEPDPTRPSSPPSMKSHSSGGAT